MAENAREKILLKIKQALATPVPVPFEINDNQTTLFAEEQKSLDLMFAENFTAVAGKFTYCPTWQVLVGKLVALHSRLLWKNVYCAETKLRTRLEDQGYGNFTKSGLESSDVAITSCECLVARTGSLLLSSAMENGRTSSVYAPVHVCIAHPGQIVYDIKDALRFAKNKYHGNLPSLLSLATGPSRTADIEKTLVVGVHGPKEVYCFLLDEDLSTTLVTERP